MGFIQSIKSHLTSNGQQASKSSSTSKQQAEVSSQVLEPSTDEQTTIEQQQQQQQQQPTDDLGTEETERAEQNQQTPSSNDKVQLNLPTKQSTVSLSSNSVKAAQDSITENDEDDQPKEISAVGSEDAQGLDVSKPDEKLITEAVESVDERKEAEVPVTLTDEPLDQSSSIVEPVQELKETSLDPVIESESETPLEEKSETINSQIKPEVSQIDSINLDSPTDPELRDNSGALREEISLNEEDQVRAEAIKKELLSDETASSKQVKIQEDQKSEEEQTKKKSSDGETKGKGLLRRSLSKRTSVKRSSKKENKDPNSLDLTGKDITTGTENGDTGNLRQMLASPSKVAFGDRFKGMIEQVKGKVKKDPEATQYGQQLKKGELRV
ncbi:hypothetical protein BY996DRAFT_6410907 [Phakopsora pachyrhizi]|nr:hypothetical protein BY996DRAFT_6410907 [Phakopsora pachyrhizi]